MVSVKMILRRSFSVHSYHDRVGLTQFKLPKSKKKPRFRNMEQMATPGHFPNTIVYIW